MKPITIIKNRSDIGAGTRGSDLGVDAIEIAAINQQNSFFNEHSHVDVPTHNETIYNKNFLKTEHRIGFVLEQYVSVFFVIPCLIKHITTREYLLYTNKVLG